MYLCNKCEDGPVKVTVKPATNYANVNGKWQDMPSRDEVWVCIECGVDSISLRMTHAQLDQLRIGIGQEQQGAADDGWTENTRVAIAQ